MSIKNKQVSGVIAKVSFLSLLICGLSGLLCLLSITWMPSGESWSYWNFANHLSQGGGFINLDRGPFYTIYLQIFRLIEYPLSVRTETIATPLLGCMGLFFILSKYCNKYYSLLFMLLWLPFMQRMEPTTQILGLGICGLAYSIAYRYDPSRPSRDMNISYSLCMTATLLRPSFFLFFLALALYNIFALSSVLATRTPYTRRLLGRILNDLVGRYTLPIYSLLLAISLNQSKHPWNNPYVATQDWFPHGSLATVSFIGHYNWRYIFEKYGSFDDKDIYFTNKEAFGGANSIIDMYNSNSSLFIEVLKSNVIDFVHLFSFPFGDMSDKLITSSHWHNIVDISLLLIIMYGALRACPDTLSKTFIITCFLSALISSASYPKIRYLIPLVPIYCMSSWYLVDSLIKAKPLNFYLPNFLVLLSVALIFSLFPLKLWTTSFSDALSYSKAGYHPDLTNTIKQMTRSCKNVLTYEHNFFASFIATPDQNVTDIWTFPPYGNLKATTPAVARAINSIDCIFISDDLKQSIGYGTNSRLRYKNYVRPLADKLILDSGTIYKFSNNSELILSENAARGQIAINQSDQN